VVFLPVINDWASTTSTGDRAELRDLPEDLPLWKEIAADIETCLGNTCPRYGDCFVTLMRQRAAESDVVIVNHHLLCADAAVRQSAYGEVIPSSPILVVDEAHQLEDVATQYFGVGISNFRIDDFVNDGERLLASIGSDDAANHKGGGRDAARTFTVRDVEELHRALTRVSDRARSFFSALTFGAARRGESRLRYGAEAMSEHLEEGTMLGGALEGVEASLALLAVGGSKSPGESSALSLDMRETVAALQRRAGELRNHLRFLLRADDPDYVYFMEVRARGVFLRAAPIDVSRIIPEAVFDRYRTVVLTSATLAIDQSFDYIKRRLGLRAAETVHVASEFDYARQALVYLPRRMPPPKSPSFSQAVAREAIELLTRSRGRAFVLFTSYAVLRDVQALLEMALPYPILVQGEAPRSLLIEQFRETPNAVLLGTSSFWQGVDVVGEALSCVIVDKLPFASPGDPITAARIDAITSAGGDAFGAYQVPLAILTLQQGLGRLIRHRTDRGVLAVLDPRVKTMAYGRRFLESLPPAPVTHDLNAVARFFM
jgi:ATP-dependent DNA helicase DinG